MSKVNIIGVTTLGLAAVGVSIVSWPSHHAVSDDTPIVVVSGARNLVPPLPGPSLSSAPILASESPNNYTADRYRTDFTNEETSEIDNIDQAVRKETRDLGWAEDAEKTVTDSISRLPSILAKDSTVICGSKSCFLSFRIPSGISETNKQGAFEAFETDGMPNGANGALTPIKMFSEKQTDGSFIIRALIIRS